MDLNCVTFWGNCSVIKSISVQNSFFSSPQFSKKFILEWSCCFHERSIKHAAYGLYYQIFNTESDFQVVEYKLIINPTLTLQIMGGRNRKVEFLKLFADSFCGKEERKLEGFITNSEKIFRLTHLVSLVKWNHLFWLEIPFKMAVACIFVTYVKPSLS